MELNIPIYRAKKIDSDEYVEGYLIDNTSISVLQHKRATEMGAKQFRENIDYFRIDPTTLAIHHENMLDSKENKIFASLQEFGKGGDIISDGEYDFVVIFNGRGFDLMFVEDNTFSEFNEWEKWNNFIKKGIQE